MNTTRQRIVVTTARLLSQRGFHGTGLNQIVAEAAAPKGSMYHYFPGGKEQLVTEAITATGHYVTGKISSADTARGVAEALVDRVIALLERSEFADGCPIAATTLDIGPASAAVADACAGVFQEWEQVLTARLVAEGAPADAAADAATLVVASIEGALVLSRARRDAAPLRCVRAALDRLLPPG